RGLGTSTTHSDAARSARAAFCAFLNPWTGAPAARVAPVAEPAAARGSMFGDWRQDRPGLRHRISIESLPAPYETRSASNPPHEVERPAGAKPVAPEGFNVELFAQRLEAPRLIRAAPNGDLFVAETLAGRVRVLRPSEDGKSVAKSAVYASGLSDPFGIAFYPPGPDPKRIYIAEVNRVIRFPYNAGDLKAPPRPEIVVAQLTPGRGGHVTRDLVFSIDGARMYVSVGSASNDGEGLSKKTP